MYLNITKSVAHCVLRNCSNVLKFGTEHDSDTAVLCAQFQIDWVNNMDVIEEQAFARFDFKKSFGWISYFATVPSVFHT